MNIYLIALSTWLHALATIVMVGYYFFTGLVYLPVLERKLKAEALRQLLEQVSTRLRPYFGMSLLIFLVTGTHLMLINEAYLGLGNFFGNLWSVLVVVKHVLVVTFLGVAVYAERAFMQQISVQKPLALRRFRQACGLNLLQGGLILLLTAIAQAG